VKNRQAAALVTAVGEPEAFVNGEDVYLLCGKGELIRHEPQPPCVRERPQLVQLIVREQARRH
jgi:hypothetical protein